MAISEKVRLQGVREERWFLFRLVLIVALVVVGLSCCLAIKSSMLSTQFPRTKLPDGTWLVVHAVTTGKTHPFEFQYPVEQSFRYGQAKHQEQVNTDSNRMVIWLTHENDLGEMLDLGWFYRAVLVVSDDLRIPSKKYHRSQTGELASQWGSTAVVSGGDETGLNDAKPFGEKPRRIAFGRILIELPLVRPREGSMRLDVYDGSNQIVAQIQLPYPKLPFSENNQWKPDQLPATRSDGNLDVTLTGVNFHREGSRLVIKPQFQSVYDGEPSNYWKGNVVVMDQIGNGSSESYCDLPTHDTVWKMTASFYQTSSGKFLPEETHKLALIPLAPQRTVQWISQAPTVNGQVVSVVGIGGQGPVEWNIPRSKPAMTFKTSFYRRGELNIGFSSDLSSCSYQTGLPFVLTKREYNADKYLQLIIRDQTGDVLPQVERSALDHSIWFFDPRPTSTAIEIEIIVPKTRHVEFFIAPPGLDEMQRQNP